MKGMEASGLATSASGYGKHHHLFPQLASHHFNDVQMMFIEQAISLSIPYKTSIKHSSQEH